MEYIKIILFFVFFVNIESKKCGTGPKGIICEYPEKTPGSKCKGFKEITLTNDKKKFIVEEHNRLRHQIATGNYTSLPKAYFMKKLSWDEELAEAAQKWANRCGEPFENDKKLKYSLGGNTAEAIYNEEDNDLSTLINKWKSESTNIDELLVKKFHPKGSESDENFAQMIWGNTDRIGCGISQYQGECEEKMHVLCPLVELVCLYSPAGNIEGQPIYFTEDNKNWVCVKEKSNALCDKIIHEGESRNKTERESNKDMKLNSLLESILLGKEQEKYKEIGEEQEVDRQFRSTPIYVEKNCTSDTLKTADGRTSCIKAIQELRTKWEDCKKNNMPAEDKDPGKIAETDCTAVPIPGPGFKFARGASNAPGGPSKKIASYDARRIKKNVKRQDDPPTKCVKSAKTFGDEYKKDCEKEPGKESGKDSKKSSAVTITDNIHSILLTFFFSFCLY